VVNRQRGSSARPPGEPPDRRRLSAWLQERLFERRIVLLTGRVDDLAASETAAALMALDAMSDAPIELHLDSPDTALGAAFVVIDTLDALRARVHAHCRGEVAGAAVGIVAAVDRRAAAPHARFRLTQPTAQFHGTPAQIATQNAQQQALLWRFYARLAQVTGRPAEEIAEDMRRGRYLDAHEALDYGLIDEVATAR
jgi:ATP-dependent Clp protease protease subunit